MDQLRRKSPKVRQQRGFVPLFPVGGRNPTEVRAQVRVQIRICQREADNRPLRKEPAKPVENQAGREALAGRNVGQEEDFHAANLIRAAQSLRTSPAFCDPGAFWSSSAPYRAQLLAEEFALLGNVVRIQ